MRPHRQVTRSGWTLSWRRGGHRRRRGSDGWEVLVGGRGEAAQARSTPGATRAAGSVSSKNSRGSKWNIPAMTLDGNVEQRVL